MDKKKEEEKKDDGVFNIRLEVFNIIDKVKDLLEKKEYDVLKLYLEEKEKYLKVMVWDDPAEDYVNDLLNKLS